MIELNLDAAEYLINLLNSTFVGKEMQWMSTFCWIFL